MSRSRAALAVAAALVALAGCATGPGLDKHVSARRTVPADAQNASNPSTNPSGSGKPVDPAFSIEKMRLMDPCKTLSKDLLEQVGTPSTRYSASAYTRCSNYMKDKQGQDLNISIEIGYTMSYEVQKADKQLAGLRSYEQKLDSGACFVSAITQEKPALGLRVQTSYKSGDPCDPGRKVLEAVVKKLKSNAPKYSPDKGSPVELDPCTVPNEATVKEAVGDSGRQLSYGLHQCAWNSRSASMTLDFRLTYLPRDNKFNDKQTEIDLPGGVKGYQVLNENAFPSCGIIVILTKDGNSNAEIVEFKSAGPKDSAFDRCGRAQAFAKTVLPKLPKA